MKILVSGASGLIGSHLVPALEANGHHIYRLVRRPPAGPTEVDWNPNTPPLLGGVDALIHLAGETIAGRWTPQKKVRIRESRVAGTRNLADALASAAVRPRCLIMASAIGYYGLRGDEVLTEESPPGSDFLAQVVRDWEAAAEPAVAAGIRVVKLRLGLVLTPSGGALKQMLLPFRLGLGGRVGSGRQWMSWITLDDVLGVFQFAVENDAMCGAVNAVAPNPVTNAEFTRALAHVLHRPALFPLPTPVVRFALGEMGESLLLSGQRVAAGKLLTTGYRFRHTELPEALRSILR